MVSGCAIRRVDSYICRSEPSSPIPDGALPRHFQFKIAVLDSIGQAWPAVEGRFQLPGITHAVDANTWDFDLKKDGKVVGHVHRVISADGKTLTVHNTGVQLSGAKGDETLVFDNQ